MASLTQHSLRAYSLKSKKSSININTSSATPTLNVKSHKTSITSFHQLLLSIEKTTASTITISNVSRKRRKDEQWRVFGSDDGSCGIAPMAAPPSAAELAKDFYNAINAKDINKLDPLLADDCQYQDLVFYVPFEGKKQGVIPFFAKMMDAMGPNIVFVIDNATEGERLTASVIWHLEWRNKVIPFATGCTFFEYEEYDGRILLSKATGMAEIPFKPGDFVLKFLKSASTFFDLYPMAAEALLKSHAEEPHEGLSSLLDKFFGRH